MIEAPNPVPDVPASIIDTAPAPQVQPLPYALRLQLPAAIWKRVPTKPTP